MKPSPSLIKGIFAQIMQYGGAFIALPFIIHYLPTTQVGLWYVFLAIQSLANLADIGFQPTFIRYFSLAASGVNNIAEHGLPTDESNGVTNKNLMGNLVASAKFIYAGIAISCALVLLTLGTWYITHISGKNHIAPDVSLTAWFIFIPSIILAIYFNWCNAFLIGTNKIAKNYDVIIITRTVNAILSILALVTHAGLIGVAVATLASTVTGRLTLLKAIQQLEQENCVSAERSAILIVIKKIWPNTWRLGIVNFSAFLITKYSIFVITAFIGLTATATYSITLQLLGAINGLALLPAQITVPTIIRDRIVNDKLKIKNTYKKLLTFYFIVFIFGCIAAFFIGDKLLELIHSSTRLLPITLYFAISLVLLLEGHHSLAALVITTKNNVPFVKSALLSGTAIAVGITISSYLGYGLFAIIIIQGLVQLSYNNWKWPLVNHQDFFRGQTK